MLRGLLRWTQPIRISLPVSWSHKIICKVILNDMVLQTYKKVSLSFLITYGGLGKMINAHAMAVTLPAGSSHAATHRSVWQHFLVPGQSPSSVHRLTISSGRQARAMKKRWMHFPGFSVTVNTERTYCQEHRDDHCLIDLSDDHCFIQMEPEPMYCFILLALSFPVEFQRFKYLTVACSSWLKPYSQNLRRFFLLLWKFDCLAARWNFSTLFLHFLLKNSLTWLFGLCAAFEAAGVCAALFIVVLSTVGILVTMAWSPRFDLGGIRALPGLGGCGVKCIYVMLTSQCC